jgi:hypothetical protein
MKKLLGVFVLLTLSATSYSQEQGHLNVRTVVQKEQVIVNEEGEAESQLMAADTVVPGVVITNPISGELMYVDGSAFGPGSDIQFSIDDGLTFANASELTVTEDGMTRPAGAEDFTHIRWVMQQELAAGAQGVARFSAVLE